MLWVIRNGMAEVDGEEIQKGAVFLVFGPMLCSYASLHSPVSFRVARRCLKSDSFFEG